MGLPRVELDRGGALGDGGRPRTGTAGRPRCGESGGVSGLAGGRRRARDEGGSGREKQGVDVHRGWQFLYGGGVGRRS